MGQLDMFTSESDYNKPVKINNGEYIYIPDFYKKDIADKFLTEFINNIKWKQESMNMYGKQIPFPRLTSRYGDSDKPYSFSGITLQPHPWTKELIEIKQDIEQKALVNFNSVLLNRYRDGNDSIFLAYRCRKRIR